MMLDDDNTSFLIASTFIKKKKKTGSVQNFPPMISKLEENFPYMTQCLGNFRLITVSIVHENHKPDTHKRVSNYGCVGGGKRMK